MRQHLEPMLKDHESSLFPLSMNPVALESPLTRPADTLSPSEGERDGVRGQFRGSKRETFRGILTPALSRWEREKHSAVAGRTEAQLFSTGLSNEKQVAGNKTGSIRNFAARA